MVCIFHLFGITLSVVHLTASARTRPGSTQNQIDSSAGNSRVTCRRYVPPCESVVFCQGPLLKDVALSGLEISPQYLALKLLHPQSETIENYERYKNSIGVPENEVPSQDQLLDFIRKNFQNVTYLEEVVPPDYKPETELIREVESEEYRQFLRDLQKLWPTLSRKVSNDVQQNPDRYSLIFIPEIFIVPGGIFKELYYWDTYWTIIGLFYSDMADTARRIIENFFYLVKTLGFIPNGTRVYYLNRSQPPLLIPMVRFYYEQTGDLQFVRDNIETMETEFNWWLKNRSVKFVKDGKLYTLFRYNTCSKEPRPESYLADYLNGQNFEPGTPQNQFYSDIKSAAESGRDFSSQWIISKNDTNKGNLLNASTGSIIPVDLNAILHMNAVSLSNWYREFGDLVKSKLYEEISDRLLKAIYEVFWNDQYGTWLDYDLADRKSRVYFYPSNLIPLWSKSYHPQDADYVAKRTIEYLKAQKIICPDSSPFYYGIPSSLYESGQQWDFSNAWSPLQSFVVEGLMETKNEEAAQIAKGFASIWLYQNYITYQRTGFMYEKYDAVEKGASGQGGEYVVQTGFAWSNGVVIQFLHFYPDLKPDDTKMNC